MSSVDTMASKLCLLSVCLPRIRWRWQYTLGNPIPPQIVNRVELIGDDRSQCCNTRRIIANDKIAHQDTSIHHGKSEAFGLFGFSAASLSSSGLTDCGGAADCTPASRGVSTVAITSERELTDSVDAAKRRYEWKLRPRACVLIPPEHPELEPSLKNNGVGPK